MKYREKNSGNDEDFVQIPLHIHAPPPLEGVRPKNQEDKRSNVIIIGDEDPDEGVIVIDL